jgi:hypothetical protein
MSLPADSGDVGHKGFSSSNVADEANRAHWPPANGGHAMCHGQRVLLFSKCRAVDGNQKMIVCFMLWFLRGL